MDQAAPAETVPLNTSRDKKAILITVETPRPGTAKAVLENIHTVWQVASDRKCPPDSPEKKTNDELVSDLHHQYRMLDQAMETILDQNLAEEIAAGKITRPIQPDTRARYKAEITALQAYDEVQRMLEPIETALAANPQTETTEYNPWLFPTELSEIGNATDIKSLIKNRQETPIPLAELKKAGTNLISKLVDEASKQAKPS